jgi:hypothetical protein
MTVTRKQLESLIAELKTTRRSFSLSSRELNRPDDQLDVFVDLDDLTFHASDHGDAAWFLAWTRESNDSAWDRRGRLVQPLAMRWGGPGRVLQDRFARAGYAIRIDFDAVARDGYESTGTLVVPPDADEIECDLRAMHCALAALRKRRVLAFSCVYPTQSAGWEDIAARNEGDRTRTAVFWTDLDHEAFDGDGNLSRELTLHWRGDAKKIAAAIEDAGLIVVHAEPSDTPLLVKPARSKRRRHIPSALEPRSTTASEHARATVRRRTARDEVLPIRSRFRSPDRKTVAALAFGLGDGLAVAQRGDRRGPPSRVITVVAADDGEVRTPFATQSEFASVAGLHFLSDGRLILAVSDLPGGRHRMTTSCWDPLTGETSTVEHEEHERPAGHRIASVDREHRFVAICRHDGVVVRAIPARGDHVWKEVVRVARPECMYPYACISPDGRALLWSEDDRQPITLLSLADGMPRWEHKGTDTIRDLVFDPRAEHVLFTRGRRHTESLDARTGKPSEPGLVERGRGAGAFAFHPRGDSLVFGRTDGTVSVASYPALAPLGEMRVFEEAEVTALAFDPSGTRLAIGSHRGEIVVTSWVSGSQ